MNEIRAYNWLKEKEEEEKEEEEVEKKKRMAVNFYKCVNITNHFFFQVNF